MEQKMQEPSIMQQFLHETSLWENMQPPARQAEEPPLPEKPPGPGAKIIPLTEPELLPDAQINFLELIELRSTVRQYSGVPLTLKELSYLLWCSQGVKMAMPNGTSRRTVPSAGGRHAFETYLYIRNVEGLQPGLYRFLAFEHALLPLEQAEDIGERFLAGFRAKKMVQEAAVTFVWAAAVERMTCQFGSRGYRYFFLDAGHACENLYLAGHTMNIGVCAVGAFYDEALNGALGLDGEKEFAVYGATVGKF